MKKLILLAVYSFALFSNNIFGSRTVEVCNNQPSALYGSFKLIFTNINDANNFKNIVELEFPNFPGNNPRIEMERPRIYSLEYDFISSGISNEDVYQANSNIINRLGLRTAVPVAMLR